MANRIMGYNIDDNKNLYIALTTIYGIGIPKSLYICKILNINPNIRSKNITIQQVNEINNYIRDEIIVGDDLKKMKNDYIKRLVDINCYRGVRLKKSMPCRGQRTRCNARTAKKMKHYIT